MASWKRWHGVVYKGFLNEFIAEWYRMQVLSQVQGRQALSGQHVEQGD